MALPNITNFLTSLVNPAQALENALIQLRDMRSIYTATDAALDVIGLIVGQPRNGQVDDIYRQYLIARIATNRSQGLVSDLIGIVRIILSIPGTATLGSGEAVSVQSQDVATVVVRPSDIVIDQDTADALISFLKQAVAAGVRVILEYTLSDDDLILHFDQTPGLDQGLMAGALD